MELVCVYVILYNVGIPLIAGVPRIRKAKDLFFNLNLIFFLIQKQFLTLKSMVLIW